MIKLMESAPIYIKKTDFYMRVLGNVIKSMVKELKLGQTALSIKGTSIMAKDKAGEVLFGQMVAHIKETG
jgi:hypothetical protein